ncbi:MAG: DUF1049 domain-containing protein [Alphaproteobacteria bacterium]|nr:DUF1049 domain-containing protein [Alphaproteobacteria bacterium]
MRLFYRALFLAFAILIVVFAVSNRETVSIAFWPLPFLADVPLYLLCFLTLLIGALIGLGAASFGRRRDRRELRARRRRIDSLERELAATHSQLNDLQGKDAPPESLPVRRPGRLPESAPAPLNRAAGL